MQRAGWKLLLTTLLPHERGGGGPGGTLLLFTEQARNCSSLIVSAAKGMVVGRCWICPLNIVTAVRPYHTTSKHKTNKSKSLCYNLLKTFISDEGLQANRLPGYLHQILSILSENHWLCWINRCPAGESCWWTVCTKINHVHWKWICILSRTVQGSNKLFNYWKPVAILWDNETNLNFCTFIKLKGITFQNNADLKTWFTWLPECGADYVFSVM